ncbi:hypothetical protein [Clostridium sp.]|uniref:hypothetical protein n=1 Tax=Clostridium sp. TaxID=1506 RepID=UPI003991ED02
MQIDIENESYFLDSNKVKGKTIRAYLELSVLLKDKLEGQNVDETELLIKKAEFISTFFIKNVSANYISNYVPHEDIELYSNMLFKHLMLTKKIDSKIIKLFGEQKKEPVKKEESVFDGFFEEDLKEKQDNQKLLDILNSIYSYAINQCRCSYFELEEKIDWYSFLDFLDYEINRKSKEQEQGTEEDVFDKEFKQK